MRRNALDSDAYELGERYHEAMLVRILHLGSSRDRFLHSVVTKLVVKQNVCHISYQVIDQVQMELAFYNLFSGDHLLVALRLFRARHDNTDSICLTLNPASSAKHLHHLEVGIFLGPRVLISDGVLDNNEIRWQVDANRKGGCAADDLDVAVPEGAFNNCTVCGVQTCVMEGHAGVDDV